MRSPIIPDSVSETLVSRECQIVENVLFLDGVSGTGKTMMAPILTTFDRVEIQRLEHIYEYVCALRFLGRIEEDAANLLIRMYVDLAGYNVTIARESNFRWKDLSGALSNPGGWRYLLRLFRADGDSVIDRINQDRPILQIVSHQLLGISSALFSALGTRLKIVEMVRHPLYLLEHWYSYINRHGTDPRDFTVWLSHQGVQPPWYALGWEDQYLASNQMDRVIYAIDQFTQLMEKTLADLDEASRSQVLIVPFERFVLDPYPYLQQIEDLLNTTTTGATRRALRKQKVPRQITTAGLDLP
ncbi:MAG: hypothetical protein ACE5Q6_09875, partial [Dehalococcoidia bacterium]